MALVVFGADLKFLTLIQVDIFLLSQRGLSCAWAFDKILKQYSQLKLIKWKFPSQDLGIWGVKK